MYDINIAPQKAADWQPFIDAMLAQELEYAVDNPDYQARTRAQLEQEFAFYKVEDAPAEPVMSFAEKKQMKLEELKAAFEQACKTAVVTVDGLTINADETANRNIQGLIILLENDGTDREVEFCLADNSVANVNLQMLKTFRIVIIVKGQQLYARKWELRSAIEAASDDAALDAIVIVF